MEYCLYIPPTPIILGVPRGVLSLVAYFFVVAHFRSLRQAPKQNSKHNFLLHILGTAKKKYRILSYLFYYGAIHNNCAHKKNRFLYI